MKHEVVVVGSANLDAICRVDPPPQPGQTVIGSGSLAGGGKGANQACALASFGVSTTLLARVGSDLAGVQVIDGISDHGVDVEMVMPDPDEPTGIAFVSILPDGDNTVVVAPGANLTLSRTVVQLAFEDIEDTAMVLCQCEVPIDAVSAAFSEAEKVGAAKVLNAAPVVDGVERVLGQADHVIMNQSEFLEISDEVTADLESLRRAHRRFPFHGGQALIVTLGGDGVLVSHDGKATHIAAPKLENIVDTTGAGDTFCAGFAAAILAGQSPEEAARVGTSVGAAATQVYGARVDASVVADFEKAMASQPPRQSSAPASWHYDEEEDQL
ncbi:ribokinase [Kribbella turkmenica]|uniref:Ribokinase n=1 Tax=Kribbella turkmenica TaxID=2530375 RepID=A0A4V2YH20_9ACTN|nr:ribokinase [Kribbella turkmenica]TDD29217.1 ribokinase [Kribbella turkmenica]